MTKLISDVQMKRLMKKMNPKREWSEGCVARLRVDITAMTHFLLNRIESNIEGNKRVQPDDIAHAYNFIANAIMLAKQPVLRHFMEGEE